MNNNLELAHKPARQDDSFEGRAPETKAANRPAARRQSATDADPVDAVVEQMERQTAAMERMATTVSAREARARIQAIRPNQARMLHTLRQSADEQEPLARRGRADPLITDRNARINADIDKANDLEKREKALKDRELALLKKERRPHGPTALRGLPGGGGISDKSRDIAIYQKASRQYLRTGVEIFNGVHLRELERKAFSTQDNVNGGYLVQPEYDTTLAELLLPYVKMRDVATVQTISASQLIKAFNAKGTTATWGGETDPRSATSTPQIEQLNFPVMELYANPLVSQVTLEDAFVDVESMINADVAQAFGVAEAAGFTSGSGNKQPKGLYSYGLTPYASYNSATNFGTVAYLPTGAAGAFAATGPADVIIQMAYNLKPGYRQNATYMMNRSVIASARTLKDVQGRYLWSEGNIVGGQPPQLNGYGITENEQMPGLAINALIMGFGDWKTSYIIVDHVGLSVLRDPYSQKPNVMFYTRKRVGGGVQNFEAFNVLRASVS